MRRLRVSPRSSIALLFALLPGCYQGVDGGADGSADGSAEDGEGGSAETGGAVDPYCEEETLPGQITHFARLTHGQYDNTVRDLLAVDGNPSDAFLGDTSVKGFSNNADQLAVTDRLARDYRRAAEDIAVTLLADPPRLATLVGCDPSPDCAATFIDEFGLRAFRRPLLDEERTAFQTIYAAGPGKYESGTDFEQGIALVVEAFLQSPSFLYRVELSVPAEGSELVALDGYEIAARLSYMMWNSTPDDELLAAALAGELDTPEGIEEHARRLLADGRAADPVQDFHAQWLHTDRYPNIQKDPMVFPNYDATTPASMAAETVEFFRRTILEDGGSYADLMTSRSTAVDAKLASIYGLDGSFGETLTPIELDPTERSGFLTMPGFLAANAYLVETSPIHRGVFIQRQVLCVDIPDPPPGIDTNLPPADGELVTTRQRVEHHTSAESCVQCHELINAPGFSFEGYDAVGTIRTVDNGAQVDAAGSFPNPDGGTVEFTNAVDMIGQLAEMPSAKQCYLKQWFRYASARVETPDDECTLDGLHETLLETDYDVQELLVALTQTVSFRYRAAQEGE